MSKNTREMNFRKVDVDELDEEQFRDDECEEDQQSDQIGQRESEVKKLTTKYPFIYSKRDIVQVAVGYNNSYRQYIIDML